MIGTKMLGTESEGALVKCTPISYGHPSMRMSKRPPFLWVDGAPHQSTLEGRVDMLTSGPPS